MKRGSPLKRKTRLGPVSAKRRAEAEERRRVLEVVARRDGRSCFGARMAPHVACSGPLDGDEVVPRGELPGGHLDPANVRLLCRFGHHRWKTENPDEAERFGLYRRAWQGVACSPEHPCPRPDPVHLLLYGRCWTEEP